MWKNQFHHKRNKGGTKQVYPSKFKKDWRKKRHVPLSTLQDTPMKVSTVHRTVSRGVHLHLVGLWSQKVCNKRQARRLAYSYLPECRAQLHFGQVIPVDNRHECISKIIISIIIIFIVLSIRRQPYARVQFGSSGQKTVSARWLPARRPDCKLDLWVRL